MLRSPCSRDPPVVRNNCVRCFYQKRKVAFGLLRQEVSLSRHSSKVGAVCVEAPVRLCAGDGTTTSVNLLFARHPPATASDNMDFAIMKNTKIPRWENGSVSIGFQFFNFFNHPILGFQIIGVRILPSTIPNNYPGFDAAGQCRPAHDSDESSVKFLKQQI
jgi:hypothetical protein